MSTSANYVVEVHGGDDWYIAYGPVSKLVAEYEAESGRFHEDGPVRVRKIGAIIRVPDSVDCVLQLDNTADDRGLVWVKSNRAGTSYEGSKEAWGSIRQECLDVLAGTLSDAMDKLPRAALRSFITRIDGEIK